MTRGCPAATRPRGAKRIANLSVAAAIVAAVMSPTTARPSPPSRPTPLITIPPANLPPLPAPDAAAAGTPSSVSALHELLSAEPQVLHAPDGIGLVLHGALACSAAAATDVVLALFADSETFDPAPVSQLLLAEQDDRRAQALFTAKVHGAPVVGVASAALCGAGGDITVVYDDAVSFPSSFPRWRQALAPSDTVEIGIADNSISEEDAANASNADSDWDEAIASLVKGGEMPIDAALARTLADRLASDTGEEWRVVSPAMP